MREWSSMKTASKSLFNCVSAFLEERHFGHSWKNAVGNPYGLNALSIG